MTYLCGQTCQTDLYFFDLIVSGVVVVLSFSISVYFAGRHLKYYNRPYFQDRIIGSFDIYKLLYYFI